MSAKSPFKSIVFAGGGSRCLWQVGFWEVVSPALKLKPDVIAGVSAGATMAVMSLGGRIREGLNFFKKITGENEKNFYLSNLFGKEPAFPQYAMYRRAILEIITEKAFKKIIAGPELRVLISRPPRFLGPRSGTVVGLLAYSLEKKISYPVHPRWASKIGYRHEVIPVSSCSTVEELADLLLHSSCTPPVVPIMKRDGRTVLDGGIIDNVPVVALDKDPGRTLVLLSRRYPEEILPKVPGRIYLQPSEEPPVAKWDYTNPEGSQGAFDMGLRDGEAFVEKFNAGAYESV